ncbi:hypothetical protein KGP36_05495 [Patescibacteria group bacterium]|nr:hypothetical protein [Patescibacteria group bacterium]MDE1940698.1 hypothetical protein [Patescibacteria group bacterium]
MAKDEGKKGKKNALAQIPKEMALVWPLGVVMVWVLVKVWIVIPPILVALFW